MKGDHCPFDHGNDAVVVDDLSLAPAASEVDSSSNALTVTPMTSIPSSQSMAAVPSLQIPPPMMSIPQPMQVNVYLQFSEFSILFL